MVKCFAWLVEVLLKVKCGKKDRGTYTTHVQQMCNVILPVLLYHLVLYIQLNHVGPSQLNGKMSIHNLGKMDIPTAHAISIYHLGGNTGLHSLTQHEINPNAVLESSSTHFTQITPV